MKISTLIIRGNDEEYIIAVPSYSYREDLCRAKTRNGFSESRRKDAKKNAK